MNSLFVIADLHLDVAHECYLYKRFDSVLNFFKDKCNDGDVIIICGDLFNRGGYEDTAEINLDEIAEMLKRLSELPVKIIFSPGNHDIATDILTNKKYSKDSELFEDNEKYSRILSLFDRVNSKTENKINVSLSNETVIVDAQAIGNTLIIALNSTHKIGIKNESGYIDEELLASELSELKRKYDDYDDLTKIAVLHHNVHVYGYSTQEEKAYNKEGSSGNVVNASEVIDILMQHGINDIICGHEHASQSYEYNNWLNFQRHRLHIVGSLGVDGTTHTITEFSINDVDGSITKEIIYAYVEIANNGKFLLFDEFGPDQQLYSPFENDICFESERIEQNKSRKEHAEEAKKYLYDVIKEEKLIATGHYHKEKQGFLTWLDMTNLISKRRHMDMIIQSFLNVYGDIIEAADAYVGLGMKGTLLVNALRPFLGQRKVSYWYDSEPVSMEKETSKIFENNFISINRILIIEDIYCTGRSVDRFIVQNKNCLRDKEIDVLCVFDMSEREDLMYDRVHDDILVDETNITYKACALAYIPARKCGEDDYTRCKLYSENLCSII